MGWRDAYQSTEPGSTLKNTERKEQSVFVLGLLQRELGGLGPHMGAESVSSHLKEEQQVSKIRKAVGLELCITTPMASASMPYLGADLQGMSSPLLELAMSPPLQVALLIRAVCSLLRDGPFAFYPSEIRDKEFC